MTSTVDSEILERVAAGLSTQQASCRVEALRRLEGGVSSLTYAAQVTPSGSTSFPIVVKMAPPGLEPVRNRDVLRQARILKVLSSVAEVPVPGVLMEDPQPPPLFAMALLPGESYEPRRDTTPHPPAPSVVRARALTAARTLAHLQSVPLSSPGIGPEAPVALRDELDRWAALLATVDPEIAPGHEGLYARLSATLPADIEPTLIHGDYRLANMIFDGPELMGVIDWEIWSVGDPRTDLAWLLMHTDPRHRFLRHRTEADIAAGEGMPSRAELLDEYLAVRAMDTTGLEWFLAYCHYKVASTVSVFVKRERRRAEPDPKIVIAGETLAEVVAQGDAFLDALEGRLSAG